MEQQSIFETTSQYIQNTLSPSKNTDALTVDTPLIQSGVLDSLTLFKLITFVQKSFGVKIKSNEITLENFATIGAIEALVLSKQQG